MGGVGQINIFFLSFDKVQHIAGGLLKRGGLRHDSTKKWLERGTV